MKINYISNLAQGSISGGWSGMNTAICSRLAHFFDLSYVGPINPAYDIPNKVLSKALRMIGLPGAFHFYSDRRLKKISSALSASCSPDADLDFYLGATPWICCPSKRPYFAYIDASFESYISLYQSSTKFSRRDINRIKALERDWINRATSVFFSSEWALSEAKKQYALRGDNLVVVGVGGNVEVPNKDVWSGEINFLAVTTDFERKGGRLSFEAFKLVQKCVPEARLIFIGASPPDDIIAHPGVEYRGFLRKDISEEKAQLLKVFSEAMVLLLPSSADTTPIIVAELGYFGCPSIAPHRFGLPEMIINNKTGILIDGQLTGENMAAAMMKIAKLSSHSEFRARVRKHAIDHMSWDNVISRIHSDILAKIV